MTAPIHTRPCLHCGAPFVATRANARFCSPAHRSAYGRSERIASGATRGASQEARRSIAPANLLNKLMVKHGIPGPIASSDRFRWETVNTVTIKLTDGEMERQPAFHGRAGYMATRALAYAVDRGPVDRPSWHAVCNRVDISPASIDANGLCDGRPTLADAKMVAMAMVMQDVEPLVLRANSMDDVTEDRRMAMEGLFAMIAKARPISGQ